MLGKWEIELNKVPFVLGGTSMNLSSIFNSINKKDRNFKLNENFQTIRYIEDYEFLRDVYKYVEPNFNVSTIMNEAKFILFSAPGATGKSALAKHVCHKYNGIYWELPDSKVAEFSFQGAIMEAVGDSKVSEFIESLKNGENFLVIDAFDEAEVGSGRTGIEFFLRDLNNVTKDCCGICAVLLARTESALFIKNYLTNNKIAFNHYEVGYFAEYNAKEYIKNGLEKFRIPFTNIVNECIDSQFREIKRILLNTDVDTFLGYAPVLNALTASYDDDRNTLNLLKSTNNSDSNCHLLKKILDDLLIRERKKFVDSLKIKLPKVKTYSSEVYNNNEQILRVFGKILYDEDTFFFPNIDKSIPIEYIEEYIESINIQLPQHPFIKSSDRNGEMIYDFTGTAFRDYIIAYSLSKEDTHDYILDEYLDVYKKYCPSQLLVEFYSIFSDGKIRGRDIPLMYNSFKAHTQLGDKISIHINGDKNDCSLEFILERNNIKVLSVEFDIIDLENGIYINQLSNCYVDIDGKIFVGDSSNEARICNSTINCNEIIWKSKHILIEAYSPGESCLITSTMSYTCDIMPKFEIKTDNKNNFKVICPSLNGYFKLIPYKNSHLDIEELNDFTSFSNLIRRIFSCLRSHSKDAPARKMDFIDNRIISTNSNKKNILNFMLSEKILYTDEQDWLYKLDTNKLSEFSIKWHNVREGDLSSLKTLYEKYNDK